MIPASFEYFSPRTLPEAVSLLTRYGQEAKLLAGGHSLVPLMKLRLAAPRYLVDLNRIDGLSYIRESDGVLRIGALTRHGEIETSDLIRARYPLLADTARVISDPLVRNMGTIGGSLAHADPAGDWGGRRCWPPGPRSSPPVRAGRAPSPWTGSLRGPSSRPCGPTRS